MLVHPKILIFGQVIWTKLGVHAHIGEHIFYAITQPFLGQFDLFFMAAQETIIYRLVISNLSF